MCKTVCYSDGRQKLRGYLSTPDSKASHPSVLVVPTWLNITESIRARADYLCELGYASFVIDIFGPGTQSASPKAPLEVIKPFLQNRNLFRQRLLAGLTAFCLQPECSQMNLAAVGFCLGGCGVLELARSGADLKGVVSLHGILHTPLPANPGEIRAKVLVLHGDLDPIVPFEQVAVFRNEMRHAGADWQMNTYGDARHSFTGEGIASTASSEAMFNLQSAERAWHATLAFLQEVLR
jgi:dienelactone hydrolase